jgi:protein SCO1
MNVVKSCFTKLRLIAALMWTLALPAIGQTMQTPPADQRPPGLGGVGIEQRLNQQVPGDLAFRDERGDPVRLGQYFGKRPLILNLVYYTCPMLCGEVLNGLTSTLTVMKFDVGKDFEVLTVSFNPRETPELAAAKKQLYLKRYGRPGAAAGWHFLTGGDRSITALARAAGSEYQYDPQTGQYAHATAIMVLTPAGKISQYYYGVEYPPRDLRLGLVQASQEKIGTAVDQLLLYCYHYDPRTGRYTAVVAQALKLAGIATLLILGTFLFVMFRLGPRHGGKEEAVR